MYSGCGNKPVNTASKSTSEPHGPTALFLKGCSELVRSKQDAIRMDHKLAGGTLGDTHWKTPEPHSVPINIGHWMDAKLRVKGESECAWEHPAETYRVELQAS